MVCAKSCSQKKVQKLRRRLQHRMNRLLGEICYGGRPIFRVFHKLNGDQSGAGIYAGEYPYHTGMAADIPI